MSSNIMGHCDVILITEMIEEMGMVARCAWVWHMCGWGLITRGLTLWVRPVVDIQVTEDAGYLRILSVIHTRIDASYYQTKCGSRQSFGLFYVGVCCI